MIRFLSLALFGALFSFVVHAGQLQNKPGVVPLSNGARVDYSGAGTAYPSSRTYGASGDTGLVIDAITGEVVGHPVTLSSKRGAGMDKLIPAARFAGKALKYVQLAQTAADLYSILKDSGFDKDPATDGVLYDPGQSQTQGVQYKDQNGTGCGSAGSLSEVLTCSADKGCVDDVKSGFKSCTWSEKSRVLNGTQWTVNITKRDVKSDGSGYTVSQSLYFLQETTLICPQYSLAPLAKILGSGLCHSDIRLPADDSLIETAIRAEPTATPDRLIKALDLAGQDVALSSPSLSGPSSVPASTKTTTNPDGTTTTTVTVNNLTYQGDTVTVTNTTTTTTNPDGTTTTTNEDNGGSPSDSQMPAVPKLYEQKYPDGVKGVWDSYSTAIGQIPLIAWVKSLSPSFGDGGCPVWIIPIDVLGIRTSGDVSIPCWLWGVLKVIFNISALLAARKLIFGG